VIVVAPEFVELRLQRDLQIVGVLVLDLGRHEDLPDLVQQWFADVPHAAALSSLTAWRYSCSSQPGSTS